MKKKMQKAKSQTVKTFTFDRKVKCACPGCGRTFPKSEGIIDDNKLYCTREHADIARVIRGSK